MKTRRRFWLCLSSTDGSGTTSALGVPFSAGEVMTQTPPHQTLSLCVALLPKLGLPPQVTQTSNLSEGIDGAAIIAALMAAIAEMQPVLGLSLDQDLHAGQVLRIVATAAKSLLGDPKRLREAVYLTEQARADQTDSAPLAHIRIVALLQLGERARLIAELDRLLAQEPPDARLQEILQAFVLRGNLAIAISQRAENHIWLWGKMPLDLSEYVRQLPLDDRLARSIPQRLIDFNFDSRKDRSLTRAEFDKRFHWGVATFHYLRYICHSTANIRKKQLSEKGLSGSEVKVLALFNQVDALIAAPDPTPLMMARDNGLSIVILEAHAGTSLLSGLRIGQLGMPSSTISNGINPSSNPLDFNINTLAADVPTRVLKLAKLIKNGKRLVRISPDGDIGEMIELDFFGRKIKLGRGAEMLAYHGRAAVFFVFSHWDGTQFQLRYQRGPVSTGFQPRETFEKLFYDFYLECLGQIVSGPPEDCFWRFLR